MIPGAVLCCDTIVLVFPPPSMFLAILTKVTLLQHWEGVCCVRGSKHTFTTPCLFFFHSSLFSTPRLPLMEQEMFTKHIRFAKTIMSALPPGEVPVDLKDTHLFVKGCDVIYHQRGLDKTVVRDVATTATSDYESCASMIQVGWSASATLTADSDGT